MKKLILLIAIAFFAITVFSQPLKKGNLVGVHVVTVELKPGVTMEQFKNYYINKYLPQINKLLDPNWQIFFAEGIRGENANQLGMIHVIKTAKDRDKYYNKDGSPNQLSLDLQKKSQPYTDELNKLGTVTTKYTDWLIQ